MNRIGRISGRETACILNCMADPTGFAIGNTLEIKESIESLKGNMPSDIKDEILEIGAYMIKFAGKGNNIKANKKMILDNIKNGKALEKFIELVASQGGDTKYITGEKEFEAAKYIIPVISEKSGYVRALNGEAVGNISVKLGAGRRKKTDKIDNAVGIVLKKKIADKVNVGETLAYIHANNELLGKQCSDELKQTYLIMNKGIPRNPTILGVIE